MIVGGLALLVVLTTAAWLSSSLLGPLRELTAGVKRFAAGDYEAKVPSARATRSDSSAQPLTAWLTNCARRTSLSKTRIARTKSSCSTSSQRRSRTACAAAKKKLAERLAQQDIGIADVEAYLEKAELLINWADRKAALERDGFAEEKVYEYKSADGHVLYEVVKFRHRRVPTKKAFNPRYVTHDGMRVGVGPVRVPYRLKELVEGQGERQADHLLRG
jgi:HAMP domain-containing protein